MKQLSVEVVETAAKTAIERASYYNGTTRVYLTPDGMVLLANKHQYSKRILWSQLVGEYSATCLPGWIIEDIQDAFDEQSRVCVQCGQVTPR